MGTSASKEGDHDDGVRDVHEGREEEGTKNHGGGGGGGSTLGSTAVPPPHPSPPFAQPQHSCVPRDRRPSHLDRLLADVRAREEEEGGFAASMELDEEKGDDEDEQDDIGALGIPEEEDRPSTDGEPSSPASTTRRRRTTLSSASTTASSPAKLRRLENRVSVLQVQKNYRQVGVRLRNYCYEVPIKMDAPTVPTVLNQSACYGVYEVCRRVYRYCDYRQRRGDMHGQQKAEEVAERDGGGAGGDGDGATDREAGGRDHRAAGKARRQYFWSPRSVSDVVLPFAKKPILKDVSLAFRPGGTVLVLGPPGSG